MKISNEEFKILSEYIQKLTGICVPEEKNYLIQQRLYPLVKKMKLKSFMELYSALNSPKNSALEHEVIAAITTNETSFFRDEHPFESLQKHIFPKIIKHQENAGIQKNIKILSVGCSTGQEPYSIAMSAYEYYLANCFISNLKIEDFSILGIDISSEVLRRSGSGVYNELEIRRGLSNEQIEKYFEKQDDTQWKVKDHIRKLVKFRQVNIVKSFMMLEGFHIVFCRNILIYFDRETKQRILDDLLDVLSDNGILIIGSSENLFCISDKFTSKNFGPTLYFEKQTKR